MPALVKSNVGSFAGTSDELRTIRREEVEEGLADLVSCHVSSIVAGADASFA